METLDIKAHDGAISVSVRAKPRASRSRIVGIRGGSLEICLAAPPVDGAANAELCRFLSRELKIEKGTVSISGGVTGRQKRVLLKGVTEAQLLKAIESLLAD